MGKVPLNKNTSSGMNKYEVVMIESERTFLLKGKVTLKNSDDVMWAVQMT